MDRDDLEIWLLDTAGEGGHSFRDFRDCIIQNSDGVGDDEFLTALRIIFEAKFIDILYSSNLSEFKKLSSTNASEAIQNYLATVAENSSNRATHFIELTKKGRDYLAKATSSS